MNMHTIENLLRVKTPAHEVPASSSNLGGGCAGNLGSILIEEGKISREEAEQVMALQVREGWRFGEAAVRLSLINEHELVQALHKQYGLPTTGHHGVSDELLVVHQPYHQRTEELRALRTQLLIHWFRQPSTEQNILAVVSPGSGEGRSYLAANLAILFSQLGERTLLIDADLRNPRQNRLFNIPDRVGLSSVLCGRASPDAAMAIPGFPNLRVLPAGAPPPNPLELLSRPLLPDLLLNYLSTFDVILMDTPPALAYSDAQAICFRAGSAIVLTHKDHTRVSHAKRVVRDLGNNGTHVVGTVINTH
jgi:protein-tyrosine kinase